MRAAGDAGAEATRDAANGALDQFEAKRTLGERLDVYQPIYLIAGDDSPEAKFQPSGLGWLGLQLGVGHESNGQAGSSSRSFNQALLRLLLTLGSLEGWHLLALPEVHDYIGGLNENPERDRIALVR
jgi:hypothetical protein